MLDVDRFVAGVHEYLERLLAPVATRLKALEARAAEPGPKGDAGKDADPAAIELAVARLLPAMMERGQAVLAERLDRAIAAIPAGKDGKDGRDGTAGVGKDGRDGANGKDGAAGKDADPTLIQAAVAELLPELMANSKAALTLHVEEAVKAIPVPANGKDGAAGKDGRDGADGKHGKDGTAGLDGKSFSAADAAPLIEAAIAKYALDFERRVQDILQRAIERIPAPKDGRDGAAGRDGVDGLSFADFDLKHVGERDWLMVVARGDIKREFKLHLPGFIDRNVYQEGKAYEVGDGVTFGGSFWIAQRDTNAKPSTDDSWRLAVKKGRDGRSAEPPK